ncbi:MAG: benzoyl-CoA reductase, bzd-type, subunit O [Deltaproteobacteria bacterium]|nr:benzoyl-CoA reductase, bzd-type, subunit O [Deltaproteobacteria bacterium]MBW1962423.1 benzoyl-CoA reductase, bzd-type, subunit O [Deltaproteobacteria bacterium]MBW2150355.1 benzoyl-CoA reductase, bzd-type, subunit O [Deltaproteobacteria bacterium]
MSPYPTEPLKCWQKAKELRKKFYENYMEAGKKGGLRWMGSAWAFDAVPAALGEDVYCITGEPYGATCAFDRPLSAKFLTAAENFGFARDLCAYMRNYWGSILTNQYALGGPFPKPDFAWTQHICCSHAKWYQNACELEGGDVPLYVVDVGAGAYPPFEPEMYEHRIKYIADQLLDGIDWLEQVTGRRFIDELFLEAVWNDIRSTNKWAQICMLNRNVPAPLDEKSIYSLYVFGVLQKSNAEFADFYDEVYEEVKDRADRGIAAVANEQARVITDTQPPWGFLKIYRYMESWGAVSIGSLYTFGLTGMWLYDPDNHDFRPRPLPAQKPKTREEACRMLADWHLSKPEYQHFYHPEYKTKMMDAIAKNWKVDGIILHYNRGCEGLTVGIAENRLGLLERGNKVMTYEGNMGDEREFDEAATLNRLDIFLDSIGLKKPK